MRRSIPVFIRLPLVWILALGAAERLDAQSAKGVTVQDLLGVRNVEEARIAPDGSAVLYVVSEPDASGVFNTEIWSVREPGTERRLTTHSARDDSPRWSRDASTIAFVSGRSGADQIWLMAADGTDLRQLTKEPFGVVAPGFLRIFPPYPDAFAWSPDGRVIAYLASDPIARAETMRKRETRDDALVVGADVNLTQIHLVDVATGESKRLTDGDFIVNHVAWSPDGTRLVFSAQPRPRVAGRGPSRTAGDDIFIVSMADGMVSPLVERDGMDSTPRWSPNGQTIAFVSHDGRTVWSANSYLCVVSVNGGPPTNLTRDAFDESIASYVWAPDSRRLYFVARERMTTQLYAIAIDDTAVETITAGERVYGSFSFSADGSAMAFLAQDAITPWEVHRSPTRSFSQSRLGTAYPHSGGLSLLQPDVFRWQGRDGLQLEGLLFRPRGATGRPSALVTCVHGGPAQGSFSFSFAPQLAEAGRFPAQADPCILAHAFPSLGVAVFLPNPRGGAGYGQAFRQAGGRGPGYGEPLDSTVRRGLGDFDDIMLGIDALIAQGIADGDRLGIMGWSYGGYMSAWAVTQTRRFAAASAGGGSVNAVSYFGTSSHVPPPEQLGPWEALKEFVVGSPLHHASTVRTPTLLQFAERDEVVPFWQGHEFFRVLNHYKVPNEFVIYPREGHMLREPGLLRDFLQRNVDWFMRWLGPKDASTSGHAARDW